MRGCVRVLVAIAFAVILLGNGYPLASGTQPAPQTASSPTPDSQRSLINRYCVTCHNQKLKTGGLLLDTVDLANVGARPDLWEKVVRKLRAGLMPPAGLPRPDHEAADHLTTWLESELDRASAASPQPGRTEPFHRLNRSEYRNAIRDLLALDVDVTSMLPADDASYGFDNIAGVLKTSPTLMERYLTAAQRISRLAIGTPPTVATVETFPLPDDLSQDDRLDGLPFGTRGGTRISYTFPIDADYLIRVRLSRLGLSGGATEDVPRFAESHDLEVSVDGARLGVFTLAGETLAPGQRMDSYQQGRQDVDATWQLRVPIKAGPHEVTAAFVKKSAAVPDQSARLPFLRPYAGAGGDTRYQPYLSSVVITGPLGDGTATDTPSRQQIFVCKPSSAGDQLPCAKTILTNLARRAYRRPVGDADLQPLLAFFEAGRREGGFERGIETAVRRILVSPQFLFRIERDPLNQRPGTVYRIPDLELASRLSFFVWSSIPDPELLDLAAQGRLSSAALEGQVRRMLTDRRSQALVHNFAGQWLFLRNLPVLSPDLDSFPDFDDGLRKGFERETELFVESIFRDDRNVVELLTADYTFVNERLARHYDIPNVRGSHFRKVNVTNEDRRGLLGHGSILSVTSYPHRTSPVLRGKWILETLLGTPPPPPPPNVPDLKDTNAEGKLLSMRDRMAQHRSNAVCASCHSMMDPPGFALEAFDAVGRHRTVDERFAPIDASGMLPDGSKFVGPTGLREAILRNPERFVTTFTEKLLTYALGRGLEPADMPAVRAITRTAAAHDYRLSSIVVAIVNSIPFQMRRAQ